MGRGVRSITQLISTWLIIGDFIICLQFICNPPCFAQHLLATMFAKFNLSNFDTRLAKVQRRESFEMQAGIGLTSKRRREHAKYSRRRLRLTATLCQRSRERKPGDAIDPPPSRCRPVPSMRIRDVLRILRTCHTNVMQPRNIVIGDAYTFVQYPVYFSWIILWSNANYSNNGIGTYDWYIWTILVDRIRETN